MNRLFVCLALLVAGAIVTPAPRPALELHRVDGAIWWKMPAAPRPGVLEQLAPRLLAQVIPPKALTYQYGLTITNAAAVQPSLCSNAGVCPGTPTWANATNKNAAIACAYTVETNDVYWSASGTAPTTTRGQRWQPGNYGLSGNFNILNFKVIAPGANAAMSDECFRN